MPDLNPKDERIHAEFSEEAWRGHLFRYRLAAGFCQRGDVVLDAACGSGYGEELLGSVEYVGADRPGVYEGDGMFYPVDLLTWQPDFAYDVFLGFETIEHLPDYGQYVRIAKQARKWILLSTPIVPTTHLNPFHLHNFAPGQIASLFIDGNWRLWQSVLQPSELSEIYVFERR